MSCVNDVQTRVGGHKAHQHVRLESGRTKAAQIYVEKCCKAICTGLQKQMKMDREGTFLTMTIDNRQIVTTREFMNVARQVTEQYQTIEEDNQEELEAAWDDASRAAFNPKEVRTAMKEDIEYVHIMELCGKVPAEERVRMTGRSPIGTRWDRHQ